MELNGGKSELQRLRDEVDALRSKVRHLDWTLALFALLLLLVAVRLIPVTHRNDEWVHVPTWRMRQLQAIEDAARETVELVTELRRLPAHQIGARRGPLLDEIKALLEDALASHESNPNQEALR